MSDFRLLKNAVAAQFARMQAGQLFRVDVDKDALWEKYLASFPAGSNPLYRERAEHDCTCCKNFVRAVGGVVMVVDGGEGLGAMRSSIWNVGLIADKNYQAVADAMAEMVESAPVKDVFLHFERAAGRDKSFEQTALGAKTWEHFFVNIDVRHVRKGSDIATDLAAFRGIKDVLLRSLAEIDGDSVDTVLELISQGSLYRGEEHKFAVETFRALKRVFDKLKTDEARDNFAWSNIGTAASAARIRNTAIGTLLVDVASGVELEAAVRSFESMVAPTNYKRPSALVTKPMVDAARKSVEDLGYTSALRRRYATTDDVKVNNVVFVNRGTCRVSSKDAFDDLATAGPKAKSLDKVEEVGIEKFLADVLPSAQSVEVLLENRHVPNLVSLIAPEDPTAARMFKWNNCFSWSYNGEAADSIRERVKAAGGSVTGDLCCRLAWDYTDDLDFHMLEPSGHRIWYQNKRQLSSCGGMLDLDANGGDGVRDKPAENIYYPDRRSMREGVYTLSVNNYSRRSNGVGFAVEIEFDGQTRVIEYGKVLRTGESVNVAKVRYTIAGGFEVVESLPCSQASREVWGLKTQEFHPVSLMMLSPNHWDGAALGNKHYFFMLDGCRNGGAARGFFNEFLKEDLSRHRKVFELLGGRMKVEDTDRQLSGLGFSSTARNSVVCRVKGSFTRTIKVTF